VTVSLVLHQARYEALGFLRNRQARYSTMVMPLILLTLLIAAFGDDSVGHQHVKASTTPTTSRGSAAWPSLRDASPTSRSR
jgi:hypothetical protein